MMIRDNVMIDDDALVRRVESAIRAVDYAEAERLCEARVGREPTTDFFRLTLARIAFVQDRRADTLRHLRVLAASIREPTTWTAIGELLQRLGRLSAAERAFRSAIASDASPRPRHGLIEVLRQQRRGEEATAAVDDLLRRWPDDERGLGYRATDLFLAGRHDEALAIHRRLSAAFDAYACAELLLRKGDDSEALRWCQESVARGAPLPWAHYRAAQIHWRRGDAAGALRWIEGAPVRTVELADYRARLLETAHRGAEADAVRAAVFNAPLAYESIRERLTALEGGRCTLHGYKDKHGWRRLHIRPLLYFCGNGAPSDYRAFAEEALTALMAFHTREFHHRDGLSLDAIAERAGDLDYTWFRNAIEHQSFQTLARAIGIRQRRKHEVVLILWCGDVDAPLAEGHGGYGYAVLRCATHDAYCATVLTHEFYHATLGLQHTDGEKDVLDGACIMGDPGGMNRLSDTYVHFKQRAMCATFPAARRLVRRGDRHEDKGEWDEAAVCYREVLRIDPLYVWPAARLAQVEVHRGNYGEAALVLRRVLMLDDAPEHSAQLAHVLLDARGPRPARDALAAMRGAGVAERAELLSGFTWAMSWYYPRALAAFRRALALNPSSQAAVAGLGDTLVSMGRFEAARAAYERALDVDPCWSEMHDRLAALEAEVGNLPRAHQLLRRAGGLKRGSCPHHWARGRIMGYEGRWTEALACIRRSLDEQPHNIATMLFEAWILLLLGRRADARDAFARCRDSERLSPCGRVAAAWVDILGTDGTSRATARHRSRLRVLFGRERRLGSLVHARIVLESGGLAEELTRVLHDIEPGFPAGALQVT